MASLTLGALELLTDPFMAELGSSWGEWSPITTTSLSLYIDGSVVTGDSTDNREITLKVLVSGDSSAVLAASSEALVSELNAPSNLLTWTPDDGPAWVFETFRAQQLKRVDDEQLGALQRRYEVTIPARPFVRGAVRLSPAAAAPVVSIEGFEGAPSGVSMLSPLTSTSSYWAAPAASASATPIYSATGVTSGFWAPVDGAVSYMSTSYDSQATNVSRFTSASPTVSAQSATIWAAGTTDYVTMAVSGAVQNFGGTFQVGVEWLDASGNSLSIDWGIAARPDSVPAPLWTAWATSRKPLGATQVRLRYMASLASGYADVARVLVMPAGSNGAIAAINATAARNGTYGLYLQAGQPLTNPHPTGAQAAFVHGNVASWADVSLSAAVGVWVRGSGAGVTTVLGTNGTLRLRLYDGDGNWAQWDLTGTLTNNTWIRCTADITTPQATSGTLDLTSISGWDLSFRGDSASGPLLYVDDVHAGPSPSPTASPRGSVLTLDIVGSAPSTAAVTVSASTAMTDWLVACIDGTDGEPLLSVTSNLAVAAAPAGYGGSDPDVLDTYSIIGCLAPTANLTSPTCTVVQKVNGTQVATRTLTGFKRTGNHYVDFGAIELPMVAVPPENLGVSYEFTLAPTSTSWTEVLVIDTDASLAWMDSLTTARKVGIVDEPGLTVDMGRMWVGDLTDRTDARAPLNPPLMVRPVEVRAPSTRLLVYSTTTAPNVALSYFPRWLAEPTQ